MYVFKDNIYIYIYVWLLNISIKERKYERVVVKIVHDKMYTFYFHTNIIFILSCIIIMIIINCNMSKAQEQLTPRKQLSINNQKVFMRSLDYIKKNWTIIFYLFL